MSKKNDITELVFITDRSGSMYGMEEDTIGGINSVINEHKKAEGDTYVSIILFDDKYEILHDHVDIKDLPELTREDYYTRGTTALLDAIGKTLSSIKARRKQQDPSEKADNIIVVITTDGYENASKEYTYEMIKKMIEKLESKKTWNFLFLGANIDAPQTASVLGINPNMAATYINDSQGSHAMYNSVSYASMSMRTDSFDEYGWSDAIKEDYNNRKKK